MKNQTHYNQMITAKTRKLLDKLCKKSKLSKPMQLEKIVEEESNKWKELSKNPSPRVSY
jgi:hypothetical protein|tara:strand:- start:1721 stop:1897 length:177 start_codon:yes stop_codon:yes gene_type:complete